LIWRHRALRNDLNLRTEYRLSVVLAYLAVTLLALGAYDPRLLAALPLVIAGMTVLGRRYNRFIYSKRGAWFSVTAFALRIVQDLGNGLSFVIGTTLFLSARYLSLRLPGALATESWIARVPQEPA
jgi:uncharacterized RDD family membrane protein YckC